MYTIYHQGLISVVIIFMSLIGLGLSAVFVIESPQYELSESVKSRSYRDINAATWPMFPIYDEMEMETFARTPRSNVNMEMNKATVLISDFWRNYGKRGNEIVGRSDSDFEGLDNSDNVDTTGSNNDAQEEALGNNLDNNDINEDNLSNTDESSTNIADDSDTSFRFSVRDDTLANNDNQEFHRVDHPPAPSVPQQIPYQPPSPLYPTRSKPTVTYQQQYPSYLPPAPAYVGTVPVPQPPNTAIAETNVQSPDPQRYYIQKPVGYPMTPQPYANSASYGLPLSSIPPHILQQLLMNANSQNAGSISPPAYNNAYPTTTYPNSPIVSIPQPTYGFMTPSTKLSDPNYPTPYQRPVVAYPNTIANSGSQPPSPGYPYSSTY